MNKVISAVFNMDCLEFMRSLPDKFFDLTIADPPYGSSIMAKNKYQRHKTTDSSYRNKTIPKDDFFRELERVSVYTIIWGCQYMMPHLNPNGSFIIWDKCADPDLHNMSACDVAWYSKRDKIRKFKGHWCGAVKCETEATIHIHQKPVMLYKWLLSKYAKTGYKIFDPHMGSQSSRVAAHVMGFDYWRCEIDEKHFNDGCKRFNLISTQSFLPFEEAKKLIS